MLVFFFLISFITLGNFFIFLEKRGYFNTQAKLKPFIKTLSFFEPRLKKQDSLITPGSYIFNLEAHQRHGGGVLRPALG